MKLAVYTVVTANYDTVAAPERVAPGVDYYCFSDRPLVLPSPWRGQTLPVSEESAKVRSRFGKFHPHRLDGLSGYDATLYLDASITIVGDVETFVAAALERPGDIFMFEHPFRSSTFAEGVAVVEAGHEWLWTVSRQLRAYHRMGFPDREGHFAGGVILRRNVPSWQPLMQEWWQQYRRWAKRDQLALAFASWRTGIPVTSLGACDPYAPQETFRLRPHRASSRVRRAPRRLVNTVSAALLGYRRLFGTAPPSELPPLLQRLRRP